MTECENKNKDFEYDIEEYIPTKAYLKKKYDENKKLSKKLNQEKKKQEKVEHIKQEKELKEKKFAQLWSSLKKGNDLDQNRKE